MEEINPPGTSGHSASMQAGAQSGTTRLHFRWKTVQVRRPGPTERTTEMQVMLRRGATPDVTVGPPGATLDVTRPKPTFTSLKKVSQLPLNDVWCRGREGVRTMQPRATGHRR